MSKPGAILAARVRSDLKELSFLVESAKHGWEKAKSRNDDYYLDGVALNLHGFYSGLEKIFEKIAATVDGSVPTAANWHQELLSPTRPSRLPHANIVTTWRFPSLIHSSSLLY